MISLTPRIPLGYPWSQLELCGGSSHYGPGQKNLHKVTDPDPTDLNKVTLQTRTRPGKHTNIAFDAIEHGNSRGGFSH